MLTVKRENIPAPELKLNPPPLPPKKALKISFASKSREKTEANIAGTSPVEQEIKTNKQKQNK